MVSHPSNAGRAVRTSANALKRTTDKWFRPHGSRGNFAAFLQEGLHRLPSSLADCARLLVSVVAVVFRLSSGTRFCQCGLAFLLRRIDSPAATLPQPYTVTKDGLT
jgi:hypothetical protein